MHIPDGFLDPKVLATTSAASASAIAWSLQKVKQSLANRHVPTIGMMAGFIFAAQMINFPVAGGTSGHLMGAALATILLGPFNSILVMSTVLLIQCLFFQDGGLLALGANIFNMAIVGTLTAYLSYRATTSLFKGRVGETVGTVLSAWTSIVAAAAAASFEIALSGFIGLNVVLPAMMGWHILIGLGEALITTWVVLFVKKVLPELNIWAPSVLSKEGVSS
ncbi:cobalamin biosynthesis protein CbiM [Clostridiales bacterium PH28_bin88]|nr:cobalamin biosynthesis protein CbiM [Clostridiales bacterium PH28_bin88]